MASVLPNQKTDDLIQIKIPTQVLYKQGLPNSKQNKFNIIALNWTIMAIEGHCVQMRLKGRQQMLAIMP